MKEIEQNPFRILDLPITASAREIAKQINTLETFAEMGKTKSFESDFSFLSPVERTSEAIEGAKRKIQLDEQKFFHSLFWFWKNNSVDELAFELINDGKVDKAKEIWEKAVFADRRRRYRPKMVIANLISESTLWSETDTDDHFLSKDGGEYTIERKSNANISIPVVRADFGVDVKDWSIECDAEWMSGDDVDGFGIIFGREQSNYFSFEISGDGYYRYGKTTNWNYEDLIPWEIGDTIEGLETNHLQIMSFGGQLELYINGDLVDSQPSEPFFGTNFGFIVEGQQTVTFRNFKFSNLVESAPLSYADGMVLTKKNFSCVKNLSLLYWSHSVSAGTLRLPSMEKALALSNRFFSDKQIDDHSKLIAGDRYLLDRKKTLEFYVTALVDSLRESLDRTDGVTSARFIREFAQFPDGTGNVVKNKFVGTAIQDLNKEIERIQNLREADPDDAISIGQTLIKNTAVNIDGLKTLLGEDDFDYQVIADKIAIELFLCGIDYSNAAKDDEPGLPLYRYAVEIAATERVKAKATEHLESCKQWIKYKIFLFCFFCERNEAKKHVSISTRIYLEKNRTYFLSRGVEYSYSDVSIPRCEVCALVHQMQSSHSVKSWVAIIVAMLIGFFVGGLLVGEKYAVVGCLIGSTIAGVAAWSGVKRVFPPVDAEGIKSIGAAPQYPPLVERISEGWSFTQPTP